MSASFAVSEEGGVLVIALRGEHDVATSSELRRHVGIALEGGTPIVLDLTEATFVDSAILGAMIGTRRQLLAAERAFAIVLPPDDVSQVKRTFELSGLAPLLPLFDARDEAIGGIRTEA